MSGIDLLRNLEQFESGMMEIAKILKMVQDICENAGLKSQITDEIILDTYKRMMEKSK